MVDYPEPVTDLIRRRKSWRSYRREPLSEELKSSIRGFIASLDPPPFGSSVRLELVDAPLHDRSWTPGTYGVVRGASHMLVGILKPSDMAFEDFGYCFESAILYCTALNLGTCWIGGTFSRDYYGRAAGITSGEMIPVVSPVGYVTEKRSILDSVFALSAGSKNRRPFSDLFFKSDFSTPLDKQEAGEHAEALEMVRLAPSAKNKQPWRVAAKNGGFHFFLSRSTGYRSLFPEVDLQRIDMGIAMFHFSSTAASLGLAGSWKRMESSHGISAPKSLEYRASWIPQL
ncbi:MAG: Nitroreductase family protein [Deltaproteobacteria bacterium ADurb.BinA179]|nr:MAG: Nitroreductase family protein [Deltaproteobacteria bacterium ADurb.BinA179]